MKVSPVFRNLHSESTIFINDFEYLYLSLIKIKRRQFKLSPARRSVLNLTDTQNKDKRPM